MTARFIAALERIATALKQLVPAAQQATRDNRQHTQDCFNDRLIWGSCFHDVSGKRIDPSNLQLDDINLPPSQRGVGGKP